MRGEATAPARQRTRGAFPFTYFVVAFAFTWTCWWLAVLDERGLIALPVPLVTLGAFGPLIAAVAVTAHESGRAGLRALLSRVLLWRVAPTWYAVALLGPPVAYLAAIALHVLAGGQPPTLTALISWIPAVLLSTVYFVVVAGLSEEVG